MSFVPDGDGHVRTALGLYALAELSDEDQAAIERHLASCERCLDEYAGHSDVGAYLDVLKPGDADELTGSPAAAQVPPDEPPVAETADPARQV
jgi:anti-sigma factor RsiW